MKDMKHYQDFVLNGLGSIAGVGSAKSSLVMSEIKNTHGIPME